MFNWFKKNKKELVTEVLPSSKEEYTMKYIVAGEEITLPFKTYIVIKNYKYKDKQEYQARVKRCDGSIIVIDSNGDEYISFGVSCYPLQVLTYLERDNSLPTVTIKEEAQKHIDLYIQNYLDEHYTTTYEDYP